MICSGEIVQADEIGVPYGLKGDVADAVPEIGECWKSEHHHEEEAQSGEQQASVAPLFGAKQFRPQLPVGQDRRTGAGDAGTARSSVTKRNLLREYFRHFLVHLTKGIVD